MTELNFVKPDFQSEAETLVTLIAAAGDTKATRKMVVLALGQAYAEGGLKATDMVRNALFAGDAP